jgi:glycosyltransferase involved in cell wall biosynthesis
MIRLLYIARYRNAMMERKIALMANDPELEIWLVRPEAWQDVYGLTRLPVIPDQPYHTIPVPLIGKHTDHHRVLYRTLTFAMNEFKPDIVHAEEEPDSLAALQIAFARQLFARQSKLILHTWQNINRPKAWYVWAITKINLKLANAILCANREAVAVLDQMGYCGVTDIVLQEGINLEVYRPSASKKANNQFIVLYVGRLAPEKGIDTLLHAVQSLGPPVQVRLVGDGPALSTLKDLSQSLQIQDLVDFAGPVPSTRIADLMTQADVLVLPSRTTIVWKEQFGRVLAEAMACKLPVVGSDSGVIPEVIGNAGLVFPEGNADALADCLRRLLKALELRRELAERGYARVNQLYSQAHIAEHTVDFYRRMISSN